MSSQAVTFLPTEAEHSLLGSQLPHFDRAAVAGGHDLGAIGREGDGFDWAAVGVLLLGFELESACGVRGKGVISERSAEEKS